MTRRVTPPRPPSNRNGGRLQIGIPGRLHRNLHAANSTPPIPRGIVTSDAEMAAININRAEFHGEWNYTISTDAHPPNRAFIRGEALSRRSRKSSQT